jgi:hypothetical protein
MTYPTSGGTPDPYHQQQPGYGQPYDPTMPYTPDHPASGQPASGQPAYGQPPTSGQPSTYGQPPTSGQPSPFDQSSPYGPPAGLKQPDGYGQQPGYGQPGYGQPGHGQSPYGAAGPYGAGPYGQAGYGQPFVPVVATTNTMAILSLVFAFVFPPAGIVMGHVSRKQIRQTGEQGEGLATAGLWVSYIFTSLYVLACVFYIALFAFIGSTAGNSSTF